MDLVKFPIPGLHSLQVLAGMAAQELRCNILHEIAGWRYDSRTYCPAHDLCVQEGCVCEVINGISFAKELPNFAPFRSILGFLGKSYPPQKPFVPERVFGCTKQERKFVACVVGSGYNVQSRLVREWIAYRSEPALTSVKLAIDRLEKIAISKDNPEAEKYKLQIDKKLDSLKSLHNLILITIKEWVDCQLIHCSIPQVVPTSLLEKVDEINRIVDRLSQREQVSALAVHSLPSET